MQENHYLVPTQLLGNEKNIAHTGHCDIIADAEDWFVDAKERLLDVNHWQKYSDIRGLDFKLTDSHGKVLNRKAHKGDHIRIEVRADATGFDWVGIEAIEYDDYPDIDMETFAMRVRQGEHPANKKEGHIVNDATTTMVIERRGKTLAASYHGRNDANGVQWLGLSDIEWTAIIKGLID